MKINRRTSALLSAGVLSLAAAVQAEEKSASFSAALSSTTISGYVDTSAQWNTGTGNENLPPYKFGGPDKADGFNLNVVQLTIAKPLDEGDWASGYRADLWMGPDANTLGTLSNTSSSEGSGDFAIRQAYVALRTPVGNGIDWKMGVFDSIIGYESLEAGNNPNFTRSYGHSIEPQTMTGLLASYRFCDAMSVAAGIANTKGPQINQRSFAEGDEAESYKAYMASIALTAPDSWGWARGSTLYAGVVTGWDDNEAGYSALEETSTSWYAGATLATPVAGLKFGAAFDYLDMMHQGQYGTAWSVAGYASYQATEKLSLHGRVEYYEDDWDYLGVYRNLDFTVDKMKIVSLTGTVQYDLWKNVISRLEVRWDYSDTGPVWGNTTVDANDDDVGSFENAFVIAANIIYKF